MKVVAFNGSARKNGNTTILIRRVLVELDKEGIETELVQMSGMKVRGCIACYKCFENKDRRCAVKNDDINACIEKMDSADGVILGSPTYFANVSSEMKALIDRAGMTGIANDRMYKRKVGAAVVAVRRAGATNVFDALNRFFGIEGMIVPGSIYWNLGIGRDPGQVESDEEGLRTMTELGQNMAWLLKKLHA